MAKKNGEEQMSAPSKSNINGLISEWRKAARKRPAREEITLRDYLVLVQQDPEIAQNARARVLETILDRGTEKLTEQEQAWFGVPTRYKLFSETLYGLEKAHYQLVNLLSTGIVNPQDPVGKMIIIFVGPTATGKSETVKILKDVLEGYSKRPVFAIKDCPWQEEPLHLIPKELRPQVEKELGVRIEGDLCPQCRWHLEHDYTDPDDTVRWWDVPVETFTFSITKAAGIASFTPSDEKTQDPTLLLATARLALLEKYGPNHPSAYHWDGEFPHANRGILEPREMLKSQEEILWVFIDAADKGEVKIAGSSLPHVSVDVVILAHTNPTEFKRFVAEPRNEALHSRMQLVYFPYTLRVQDEVQIYRKLIGTEGNFKILRKCHIAPGALELAAMFAVLTRLVPSEMGVGPVRKMRVYNGEEIFVPLEDADKAPVDIRVLREEGQRPQDIAKREGMFGIDPRDVLAALSTAIAEQEREDGCLTPITTIEALRQTIERRMGYTPEEIESFKQLLTEGEGEGVMSEYREWVLHKVTRAFLHAYEDLAEEVFRRYIAEVRFYLGQKSQIVRGQLHKIPRDAVTGKIREPDAKLLRSVEQHIPIEETAADTFRRELLIHAEAVTAAGEEFGFQSYPPLAEAVERKLLDEQKASLTVVLAKGRAKGEEEGKRAQDLFDTLRKEEGFCPTCAQETIEEAAKFLSE